MILIQKRSSWPMRRTPKLSQDIVMLFTHPQFNPNLLDFKTVHTNYKGHGRIEERTLTAVSMFPGEIDWTFITQVFRMENTSTFLTSQGGAYRT